MPGEFCPKADYGISGTTAGGTVITCKNDNGWRWEA
jgi:hypothetical protein